MASTSASSKWSTEVNRTQSSGVCLIRKFSITFGGHDMAFHHLAMATRDMKGIDHFYREVMGFDFKKVEIGPTLEGGWAKHFFYEIEPDHFIAFWELHGEPHEKPFETSLSKAAGLPEWVNHISFYSPTELHLGQKRDMWLAAG